MDSFRRNFLYSVRMLKKSPVFSAVCVITLAVGIGATSMIYSVVNPLLLQPLPYPDSQRLIALWGDNPNLHITHNPVSYPNFEDWRGESRSLQGVAAYGSLVATLADDRGYPELIRGAVITPDLFSVLAVSPSLGRSFTAEEDQAGGPRVAVISDRLWRRRFGSDTGILHKTVTLNNQSCMVIGVMPPTFEYPKSAEIWLPLKSNSDSKLLAERGSNWLRVIGRLKPGTSLENSRSELATISARLQRQYPAANANWKIGSEPLRDLYVGELRSVLWYFVGAVLLVLLIACVNVANLLLARSSTREAEMALRFAMGARRSDVLRQLFTEGLLLSLLGGALGIALAYGGLHVLLPLLRYAAVPRLDEIRINGSVIIFTLALSVLTTVLFGLLPALRLSRPNLGKSLNERQSGSIQSGQKRKLRGLLVVFETGLSLVLLVSAGLLLKSLIRLQSVDMGFNPNHLITFSIDLHSLAGPSEGMADIRPAAFYDALGDRLQHLPGVDSVASVTTLPMTGSMASMAFHIQGKPLSGQEPNAGYDSVSSGYFKTMGIPLLRGRYFNEQDRDQTPPVIIINQEMATEYFAGSDALGKRIIAGKGGKAHEIVGVVGNVKHEGLYLPDRPAMYVPAAQDPWLFSSFVVRTEQNPDSISKDIRDTLWSMNKTISAFRLTTMKQIVSGSIGQRELNSLLLGAFAGVALLLCAIGLYGMMAYSVSLRSHEIGIRMAIGAQIENVRHMILKEGLYLALGGIGVGILGSLLSTRFLKAMLFGVNQIDLSTLAAVSGVLLCVAAFASYIPARRATKIDPIIALRHE